MSGGYIEETRGEADTVAAGARFGERLADGDVVLLFGGLGAGKTAFVRGIAEGLGADGESVSSPTFTLIQEYRGRTTTLYHVDLYRLAPTEVDDLGLDEIVAGGGIVAVEWAERWRDPPEDAIEVRIDHVEAAPEVRRIAITLPAS